MAEVTRIQQIVMRYPRHQLPIAESEWRKNYGSLYSPQP
jgi:hypothetical protein